MHRVSYAAFDRDRSAASYELLAALDGSGVFQRVANLDRAAEVKTVINEQHALLVVQIDQDFERRLLSGQSADVQVIADGRNSTTARTVLAALHEVENALSAYSAEQNRRAALEVAVAQNRDALTLARTRYASGITSFLAVLDAERTLQQTELALADSTAAVSIDLVVLYKALGGGWEAQVTTFAASP